MIEEKITRSGLSSTFVPNTLGIVNGAATTYASLAAAIDAVSNAGGGVVELPPTAIDVGAGVTAAVANPVVIRGVPGKTVLAATAGTSGTVLTITGSAGTRCPVTVEGVTFDSGGTSSTSTAVTLGGLILSEVTEAVVRNCTFIKQANTHGLRVNGGAGVRDVTVRDCMFRDSFSNDTVTKTSVCGVWIQGPFQNFTVDAVTVLAASANPIDIGVLIVTSTGTGIATSGSISRCEVSGLTRHGIGATDENPTASFRAGKYSFTDNRILACKEQGIKLKNVRRVTVQGNYIESCNSVPEPDSSSLRGGIFLNGTEAGTVSDNVIINDYTNGIRSEGISDANGGGTNGTGRGRLVISGNVIDGAVEASITITQRCYTTAITGNTVTRGGNTGINVAGQTAASGDRCRSINVTGNIVRSCASQGIYAQYVDKLVVADNIVESSGNFGILTDQCTDIAVSGNVCLDNSQNTTNTSDGIRYSNITGAIIVGNRCGNRAGSTQRYGISVGGTNTEDKVAYNQLTNNATGTLSGTPGTSAGN